MPRKFVFLERATIGLGGAFPLVVEALRLYTRIQVSEPATFKAEKWDWRNQHIEEIVASTSLLLVACAAFDAAVEQYPGAQLTLRQGIRVILKAPLD